MSNLERTSLEAHVDLCQLRYEQLDLRLSAVEQKIDDLQKDVIEGHKSMKTTIITSAASIVVALLTVVATVLMKF